MFKPEDNIIEGIYVYHPTEDYRFFCKELNFKFSMLVFAKSLQKYLNRVSCSRFTAMTKLVLLALAAVACVSASYRAPVNTHYPRQQSHYRAPVPVYHAPKPVQQQYYSKYILHQLRCYS